MTWEEVLKNYGKRPYNRDRRYRKLDEPFNPFARIKTSKDDKMRSIAEDVLTMWRNTDWRTTMLDDIFNLPKEVNSHSVEKLEEIKNRAKYHLRTDKQRNEFERLMDKLIE